MTFTPPTAQYPRLFQDSFDIANRFPLTAANWFTVGGGLADGVDELGYRGFKCVTTVEFQADGQAVCIGANFPPEQWCEAKVASGMTANGNLFLYLRAGATTLTPCYALAIVGPADNANYTIYQIDPTGGVTVHTWAANVPFTFVNRITFTVENGKLTFYADGVQVFQGLLSDSPTLITSGNPGIQLASLSVPQSSTDIELTYFQAGSSTL